MKSTEHHVTNKNIKRIQRKKTDYLQRNDNQLRTAFSKLIPKDGGIMPLNYGRKNSLE